MAGIPGTGNVWLGEVGGNQWEEINVVPVPATTAGNYGYPGCEGNCNTNGVVDPLYTYQHPTENGAAAIGGDFYTGTTYPAEYRNNYFFSLSITSPVGSAGLLMSMAVGRRKHHLISRLPIVQPWL